MLHSPANAAQSIKPVAEFDAAKVRKKQCCQMADRNCTIRLFYTWRELTELQRLAAVCINSSNKCAIEFVEFTSEFRDIRP